MGYNILKSIIPLIEKYQEQPGTEDDLDSFLEWVYGNSGSSKHKERAGLDIPPGENLEGVLSKYIIFLYRYARTYVKKALQDTALTHFDDFAFMVTLFVDQSLSKTELIQKNILDKSSGSEIIKRLIKQGFMEEFPSEKDKRSKLVRLTGRGTIALMQSFEKMGQVSLLVSGILHEDEKIQLFDLLHKLHHFHLPIFMESRNEPLSSILMASHIKKAEP